MTTDTIKANLLKRIIKAKEQTEQKNGKSLEELYREKEQRVADASQLKVPDRVPVTIQTTVFAAKYAGVPLSSMYYGNDYSKPVQSRMVSCTNLYKTASPEIFETGMANCGGCIFWICLSNASGLDSARRITYAGL